MSSVGSFRHPFPLRPPVFPSGFARPGSDIWVAAGVFVHWLRKRSSVQIKVRVFSPPSAIRMSSVSPAHHCAVPLESGSSHAPPVVTATGDRPHPAESGRVTTGPAPGWSAFVLKGTQQWSHPAFAGVVRFHYDVSRGEGLPMESSATRAFPHESCEFGQLTVNSPAPRLTHALKQQT